MNYTQHPLSAAFPGMSTEEFSGLCDDMRMRGQRDEITIYDGQVLDGWHRYQACCAIAIPPRVKPLPEGIDPVAFVKSYNLHRRHLSATQRATAVLSCNDWAKEGRPKNPAPGAGFSKPMTVSEMAKEAEVSPRTIRQAKTAVEAGMVTEMRDGKLSAKKASEIAKPKAPPEPRTIEVKPEPPRSQTIEVDRDDYEEMKQEIDRYHADSVALESVLDADDALAAAVEEIRKLTVQLATLQTRFNGLQGEKNEAVKLVKARDREISRLKLELDKHVIRTRGGMPI